MTLVLCISPSFVLERFQSSEEKVSLDLAFDLHDRPAASLETDDVSIAVSRDCRYRKLGEVLLIQLTKRKMLLCAHAHFLPLVSMTYRRRRNLDWPTLGDMGISLRKVSRKQTSHICVIGESANNRTTPGSSPGRRSCQSR